MNRSLLFFLSSFGLLIPACLERADLGASGASSQLSSDDAGVDARRSLIGALPPSVAPVAEQLLARAPGERTRSALFLLLSSKTFVELGTIHDEYSCVAWGDTAQLDILAWVEEAFHFAPETSDELVAPKIDVVRIFLDGPKGTSSWLDTLLKGLAQTLADKKIQPSFHPATNCTATTKGTATTKTTKTSYALNGGLHNVPPPSSLDAHHALTDMFATAAAAAPPASMVRDWNVLRSRFQRTLSKDTPKHTPVGIRELDTARRAGSATLARDTTAARKFGQGIALVDQLVASGIAPTPQAMSLLHAVIAEERQGQMRTAGEEVRQGRRRDRLYLPGANVEQAVTDLFRQMRAASDQPAPALAATFDQRMISIHPYSDANGRTTRLMTDWILARAGYPPAITTASATLFWQQGEVARLAHLERLTDGMRRSVELLEA